jgi:hypothetical protein
MSEIEKVLCEVTSVARRKKEATQSYLGRLLGRLEKLFDEDGGDDTWEQLGATKGAQEWFNDAIKADKAKKDLPGFTDDQAEPISEAAEAEPEREAKSEPEGETEQEGDSEVVANGKAKHGKSKKTAAAPAKKAPVKEAKQPGPGKKAGGSLAVINLLLLKDPSMTVEDLSKALAKKGMKPTPLVVSAARSRIRQTFRVLQEEGHLKGLKL